MKIPLLAVPILFIACIVQEQSPQPKPSSLRESWNIWENLKSTKGGNYSYSVRYGSVFQFWSEYKFSIRNDSMKTILVLRGKVDSPATTRDSLVFETLSDQEKTWYKTIDELYQFCQDSVLTLDKSKNDISELQFLSNGVLKNCTYYPHGCQDDCTMGPRIDSVFF
jgi:hypothetical protein